MRPVTLCAFADEAGAAMEQQILALRENHIPCLEVRGVDGRNITELTVDEAKRLRDRLGEKGLRVWSVGSPIGKVEITDAFEPEMERFRHTLELAAALEASYIRLFSFYIPQGEDPNLYRDQVLERLDRFCEAARGSGVVLCHENEKGIYGDVASRCADIHRHCPALRAVFDPANFIQCGQPAAPAWQELAPFVEYFHIKDALEDGTVVPAGKGLGELPRLLEAYFAQGGRVLTLEPHLAVFEGLSALERDQKSAIGVTVYPSARAAFDAAAAALRTLLGEGLEQ